MAASQIGAWQMVLNDRECSEPLRLERDLHVTRATLELDPATRIKAAAVFFQINGGYEAELCRVGDHDGYTLSVDMNRVFSRGDTIRFAVGMMRSITASVGTVRVEGYFDMKSRGPWGDVSMEEPAQKKMLLA